MAAALPDNDDTIYLFQNRHHQFASFSFRSGRETFIVKNYRSMLNFFYSEGVRLTA